MPAWGLPRVAAIRDRSVPHGDGANGLLGPGQLVDDPVATNAKRAEPAQPPCWLALVDRVIEFARAGIDGSSADSSDRRKNQ
jgi:hypothetical protein